MSSKFNLISKVVSCLTIIVLIASIGFTSGVSASSIPIVRTNYQNILTANTIIFYDDLSTDKGWVNQSNGYIYRDTINQQLVWSTTRNDTRRYYISIPSQPGVSKLRLEFKFYITSFLGNGGVAFGLVENLDAPVQFLEMDATGFFVRIIRFWENNQLNWVNLAANYADGTNYSAWDKKVSFPQINTWLRMVVDLEGVNWTLSLYDNSGNLLGSFDGTMPQSFTSYNYLMLFHDKTSGWESASGYLDDITLSSSTNVPDNVIFEDFNSPSIFTQTSPEINISGGRVNWTVHRSPAQYKQYVYRSIPEFFGDFRLTVKGRIDNWTNNCGIKAGIGDAPGSGISVIYNFYGGGCPTSGPNIGVGGSIMNYSESACNFSGDWLWINRGEDYTATLSVIGSDVTLSVPGVGTAQGKRFYDGKFNTLFVGVTGDGDWPSCSGSIDYMEIEPLSDHIPPSQITDLQAIPDVTPGAIKLIWTAPGDDGNLGTATQYDIRYNTAPITDVNWSTSLQIEGEPAPSPSGTRQDMTITMPYEGQQYYFAIKVADDENLWSNLSNVVSVISPVATDTIPPSRVIDLSAKTGTTSGTVILTWTSPGDDGSIGTANNYQIRYSSSPINNSNWTSASDVSNEPTPKSAGSVEIMTVSGLVPGNTYYFALRTYDEAGNASGVSNTVSAVAYQTSQPLPDLRWEFLEVSPSTIQAGQKIKITFKVKNIGASQAGFHMNTVYLAKDENSSKLTELCNQNLSGLDVNQTSSHSCEVYVPSNVSGKYNVILIVDSADFIQEIDSENNRTFAMLTVTLPPSQPTPPPERKDIRIIGMEITQGIQVFRMKDINGNIVQDTQGDPPYDIAPWKNNGPKNNQVRLVRGRDTAVRVYLDVNPPFDQAREVSVRLTYKLDGGPTILVGEKTKLISGNESSEELRGDTEKSFDFIIKGNNLYGSNLTVYAEVLPVNGIIDYSENKFSQGIVLEDDPLKLVILEIPITLKMDSKYTQTGDTNSEWYLRMKEYVLASLPFTNRTLEFRRSATTLEISFSSEDCKKRSLIDSLLGKKEPSQKIIDLLENTYKNLAKGSDVDVVVGILPGILSDECFYKENDKKEYLIYAGMAFDIGKGHSVFVQDDATPATLAHELSHLLPGRTHPLAFSAPKGMEDSRDYACNAVHGPWGARWPSYGSYYIQDEGFALREVYVGFYFWFDDENPIIYKDCTLDLMTYCTERWPSSYTWETWIDWILRQKSTSKSISSISPDLLSQSSYRLFSLVIDKNNNVGLLPTWLSDVPIEVENGDYCLRTLDSSSQLIEEKCFGLDFINRENGESVDYDSIQLTMSHNSSISKIQITRSGSVIYESSVSALPSVNLDSPNNGGTLSGEITISWSGFDPNSDSIYYQLLFSKDNGATWQVIVSQTTSSLYKINSADLPGTNQGLFRVMVSDGLNVSEDMSDVPFIIENKPPVISVNPSLPNSKIPEGKEIRLIATASDLEDGNLPSIVWSSNIDGSLGTGNEIFKTLSAGVHLITARVADSAGLISETSFNIEVLADTDHDGMPDVWELEHGLDPYSNDADADPDREGLTNFWEYQYGNDPQNWDSDFDGVDDLTDLSGVQQYLINLPLIVK